MQLPHMPSIGNDVGVVAEHAALKQLLDTSCSTATPMLHLECSYCSTPIVPRLVTGCGLAAMQRQYHSSCGNRLQLPLHESCCGSVAGVAP